MLQKARLHCCLATRNAASRPNIQGRECLLDEDGYDDDDAPRLTTTMMVMMVMMTMMVTTATKAI